MLDSVAKFILDQHLYRMSTKQDKDTTYKYSYFKKKIFKDFYFLPFITFYPLWGLKGTYLLHLYKSERISCLRSDMMDTKFLEIQSDNIAVVDLNVKV